MASMEGATVGTEVLMFATYGAGKNGSPYIVTKVGRKLIYVTPGDQYKRGPGQYREFAFRIDTGIANDGYGHQTLCTYEQHEASQLRTRLLKEMGELGLEVVRYKPTATERITNEALVQILKILRNLKEVH